MNSSSAAIVRDAARTTRIRVVIARSRAARARGLLFRPSPLRGEGMMFPDCGSVHTWLMSYPIDLVYLDNVGLITRLVPEVRPWRFSLGGRRARHALELAAGEIARLRLVTGQRLELDSGHGRGEEWDR